MYFSRSTRNIVTELGLLLAACGPGTPAADTTGGTSTGDASSEPTSSEATTTAGCFASLAPVDEAEPTPRAPIACAEVPGLPCTELLACPDGKCGSHVSPLDMYGCPRRPCAAQDECDVGQVCKINEGFPDFDALGGSVACTDTDGLCACTLVDAPAPGYCMPTAIVDDLAGHCDALTTSDACDRFDVGSPSYCRWTPTRLVCDGECAAPVDAAACVHFSNVGNGCSGDCPLGDGFGYSRPRGGGSELLVNLTCGDEPTLWSHCFEVASGACDCACGE